MNFGNLRLHSKVPVHQDLKSEMTFTSRHQIKEETNVEKNTDRSFSLTMATLANCPLRLNASISDFTQWSVLVSIVDSPYTNAMYQPRKHTPCPCPASKIRKHLRIGLPRELSQDQAGRGGDYIVVAKHAEANLSAFG